MSIQFEWRGNSDEPERESLWARDVSGGRYKIQSVPFFVYDISYGDVVLAERDENALVFARVVARGGHSTYRVFLSSDIAMSRFLQKWEVIEHYGCSYERASDRLLAIDVHPQADVLDVYRELESGERDGLWEFEEGHCGHSTR